MNNRLNNKRYFKEKSLWYLLDTCVEALLHL